MDKTSRRVTCVAVDASKSSDSAVEWVGRSKLADRMDEVRMFTVLPPSHANEILRSGHLQGTYSTHPEAEADPAEVQSSQALLQESKERLVSTGVKGAKIQTNVLVASAGDAKSIGREISSYADECGCEVVVMGSRGLGITKRALLSLLSVGSVIHKDPKAVEAAAGEALAREQ